MKRHFRPRLAHFPQLVNRPRGCFVRMHRAASRCTRCINLRGRRVLSWRMHSYTGRRDAYRWTCESCAPDFSPFVLILTAPSPSLPPPSPSLLCLLSFVARCDFFALSPHVRFRNRARIGFSSPLLDSFSTRGINPLANWKWCLAFPPTVWRFRATSALWGIIESSDCENGSRSNASV